MGKIRLRIKALVKDRGWTMKEVARQAGIPYTTVATYANSPGMATVDYTAIHKLAQVFEISVEELVEIVEE